MVNVMERIKSVYSDVLLWFGLVLLKVICLSWWHFFFFFFFFLQFSLCPPANVAKDKIAPPHQQRQISVC